MIKNGKEKIWQSEKRIIISTNSNDEKIEIYLRTTSIDNNNNQNLKKKIYNKKIIVMRKYDG